MEAVIKAISNLADDEDYMCDKPKLIASIPADAPISFICSNCKMKLLASRKPETPGDDLMMRCPCQQVFLLHGSAQGITDVYFDISLQVVVDDKDSPLGELDLPEVFPLPA